MLILADVNILIWGPPVTAHKHFKMHMLKGVVFDFSILIWHSVSEPRDIWGISREELELWCHHGLFSS